MAIVEVDGAVARVLVSVVVDGVVTGCLVNTVVKGDLVVVTVVELMKPFRPEVPYSIAIKSYICA